MMFRDVPTTSEFICFRSSGLHGRSGAPRYHGGKQQPAVGYRGHLHLWISSSSSSWLAYLCDCWSIVAYQPCSTTINQTLVSILSPLFIKTYLPVSILKHYSAWIFINQIISNCTPRSGHPKKPIETLSCPTAVSSRKTQHFSEHGHSPFGSFALQRPEFLDATRGNGPNRLEIQGQSDPSSVFTSQLTVTNKM